MPDKTTQTSPTLERLAELEAQHGRIAHVRGKSEPVGKYAALLAASRGGPTNGAGEEVAPWEAVFRKPTRGEYKAFRSRAHNPSQKPEAQEILARNTIVWISSAPTATSPQEVGAALATMLDDYPAIGEAAADAIGELAGIATDESGKG